ncbi:helix-turn-helix domain-containing protein [Streptomyces venezuelae]|uniref:Helix-turn-helix domain-containing protein n=1 Tax=Streptomyces venezuelae TaxID=54571 RepID=A0A5P2BFV6_STRVZ|nr:helix-turn-helix domain-containing protein [Streptomyces venezuelae]QES28850.1 helix-turn-helix domain-containing protein [Streptomyces venezuelae]
MDTQNPSAPPRPQSAPGGNQSHARATRHPRSRTDTRRRPTASAPTSGVTHENTRHTTRFTVVGNHLTQHQELSLLAIGLGCHIQSLPAGAHVDIKSLTKRFPEGATRIAGALRELETHGYLRRDRERTASGRIVTRTISCNQPQGTARRTPTPPRRQPAPIAAVPPRTSETPPAHAPRTHPRPLPAVPHPAHPTPALLEQATATLTELCREAPHLLLTARDTAHLTPGVAAWLEREASPASVRHALTHALPPDGPRHPAALLSHRLTALLPPPPRFHPPQRTPHPLQNCETCDRAYRAPEPGRCRDCRIPPCTA